MGRKKTKRKYRYYDCASDSSRSSQSPSQERRRPRDGSHSRSPKPDPFRLQIRALKCVSRGKVRRLRKLLSRARPPLDLTAVDTLGRTLLHHACACGHAGAVELLLRHGSSAAVADASGDTPAHLAAHAGHLEALAEVLKAPSAPRLDAAGAGGAILLDLVGRALREGEADSAGGRVPPLDKEGAREGSRRQQVAEQSEDEEARWQRRLREEYSDDDGNVSGGWDETPGGASVFGEDDDEWADRIWREMWDRRNATAAASAAAFTASLRTETARRAAEAAHRSKQILEEEQAKDAAWRHRNSARSSLPAIEAGPANPPLDLAALRISYDMRWEQLDRYSATSTAAQLPLRYSDIPWPLEPARDSAATEASQIPSPSPPPPSAAQLRDFFCLGATGPADVKKRLRTELLRWHPDKFQARFSGRLVATGPLQCEATLARVHQLAQVLTQVLSSGAHGT